MSKTAKDLKVPYPTEGIIRSAQLSDTVAPENSAQIAVNGNFDRIGAFQTRPGVSGYAPDLGGAVISFGTISIQQSGLRQLIAQVGTQVFALISNAWTLKRTLSGTNKARYSQFLNLVYQVNGNNTVAGSDPVQTYDGSAFGSTNVSFLPKGDYVQAGFEGRVWIADKALDRLYYSDIVQPVGAGYVITTNNPCDFIEKLSPQDGQSMTGLFRVPKALLVFKQNNIYRVYGAFSIDSYPAYNVGTYSQESIVQAKDGVYFHHSSGFYKFNYDGQPIEISRRVKDFVKAILRTNYENIVGIYDGEDAVEWSVGQVTVEGATYQNCIMRYSISTQVWTIYDLTDESPTAMIVYDDGTLILPIVGTNHGKVGRLNNGETDFGKPITFEYITRWMSLTDQWSHAKALSGMAVYTQNGAGTKVEYQIDKQGANQWTPIDTINQDFVSLFPNMSTDDFNNIRFRLSGQTKGPPMIFEGIEFLSIQDKGYNEN